MKTLHYVGVYITVKVKSSLRCQPWPFFFYLHSSFTTFRSNGPNCPIKHPVPNKTDKPDIEGSFRVTMPMPRRKFKVNPLFQLTLCVLFVVSQSLSINLRQACTLDVGSITRPPETCPQSWHDLQIAMAAQIAVQALSLPRVAQKSHPRRVSWSQVVPDLHKGPPSMGDITVQRLRRLKRVPC